MGEGGKDRHRHMLAGEASKASTASTQRTQCRSRVVTSALAHTWVRAYVRAWAHKMEAEVRRLRPLDSRTTCEAASTNFMLHQPMRCTLPPLTHYQDCAKLGLRDCQSIVPSSHPLPTKGWRCAHVHMQTTLLLMVQTPHAPMIPEKHIHMLIAKEQACGGGRHEVPCAAGVVVWTRPRHNGLAASVGGG